MPTCDHTLYRYDDDGNETVLELSLSYSAHGPCRGAREPRTGLQLEPDEPAGIEFEGAFDVNGQPAELSSAETEECEQACDADYRDRERDAIEAAAEAAYERLRDRRLGL